jgi:aminoglycoside phosphotransferase (APT) family kinase protein
MLYTPTYYKQQPIDHLDADTPIAACLDFVLSSCGISVPSTTVAVLREGKEKGRQAVFSISRTWIVRIFELLDGYRQPASLVAETLEALREVAPVEPILYHGCLPPTPFHYTVTTFVPGQPLTRDQSKDPVIRAQVADLIKAIRSLPAPQGSTVMSHMQPRLSKLQSLLDAELVSKRQRVGQLCVAADYQNFKMVVSHRDLALENILIRGRSIAAIIDWEFMAYEPEFVDALYFSMPANQKIWGEDFAEVYEMGFEGYSEQLLWTEHLCFLAEEYEAEFGEMLEAALQDAGK